MSPIVVVNRTWEPTILLKLNTGPFVETAFGRRMLRKHGAERLMVQGVQTRVFAAILRQLAEFLTGRISCPELLRSGGYRLAACERNSPDDLR